MVSARLLLASSALLACGETPFIAFPPAPEGARSVLIAYRSETTDAKSEYRLFDLGGEVPVRGDLTEVAVLYFDETPAELEAGEDCDLLYPRAALDLDSAAAPQWRELDRVLEVAWLVELLIEEPSNCQPCYAFERERWLPRANAPSTLLHPDFALVLPSGASLLGGEELTVVTDQVRALADCPVAYGFFGGVSRAPGEIYVTTSTSSVEPAPSSIHRVQIDELNLRCLGWETIASGIPGYVRDIISSSPEEPLELLYVTSEGRLHRWTESGGNEEIHTFERSASVERDSGSIVRTGPAAYAATAGGGQIAFWDSTAGVRTQTLPTSSVSMRGLRDMAFVEGLGLFVIEGRDNLYHFDAQQSLSRIAVPSSFLLSHIHPLDRGVLVFARGGNLFQYAARSGFCPAHKIPTFDADRSIETATLTRERIMVGDASRVPTEHVLELPFSPVKPPLVP